MASRVVQNCLPRKNVTSSRENMYVHAFTDEKVYVNTYTVNVRSTMITYVYSVNVALRRKTYVYSVKVT